MKRGIWLAILVVTLLSAFGALKWLTRKGPSIPISRADVTRIDFTMLPEGLTPAPFLSRPSTAGELPLAYIEHDLPIPLPGMLWQGFGCKGGMTVNIHLQDGRTIVYGPCHLPDAIARIRADALRLVPLTLIKEIAPYPYPEGTDPPPFEQVPTHGAFSLVDVASAIPAPLPKTLPQGGCKTGLEIVITTISGKPVTYGPCKRPPSIDALYQAMVAAWRAHLP